MIADYHALTNMFTIDQDIFTRNYINRDTLELYAYLTASGID